MIKIENTDVVGWEPAIRGMRNPMNSWDKSDSEWRLKGSLCLVDDTPFEPIFHIGPNDHDLMIRLCKAGSADAKFRRMIICYADITGPLYWLKEMDTYRMGVEKNSCSTMHKITSKEFTPDDFSHEHLLLLGRDLLNGVIDDLNAYRGIYLNGGVLPGGEDGMDIHFEPKSKEIWWQMIQLLPSSYNQRRTCMFSYEALSKIYRERRNHKLDEWHQFCDWIETLPYSEIITLKEDITDERE